jgi:tetratricopeptide (TPR) repeat protein
MMPEPKTTFYDSFHKAQKALNQGKLQLSLGYVQRCIDENPRFYDAYHVLGKVFRKMGRLDEASQVLRQLDRVLGFDPEVRLEIARLELARGRYGQAMKNLQKVLKQAPQLAEGWYLMGEAHRCKADFEQAETCYAKTLERDATHSGARRGINEMLRSATNGVSRGPEEPEEVPAPNEEEDSFMERLNKAGQAIAAGHLDTAIALLRVLVRENPDDEMVRMTLAWSYFRRGATEPAIRQLKEFLKDHPESAFMHYHTGLLYHRQGQIEEAARHQKAAVSIDPDYFEARFELAVLEHRLKLYDEAESSYRAAIQLVPDDIRPRVNLAHLWLTQNREGQAESALRQVLEIDPACAEALLVLGNLFYKKGQKKQAEKCFRRILDTSGHQVQACIRLAQILEEQGIKDEALQWWRAAGRQQPGNPEIEKSIKRLSEDRGKPISDFGGKGSL